MKWTSLYISTFCSKICCYLLITFLRFMIVFFTASLKLKEIYQKYYDVIVKTIQKEHEIISLEIQDYSYLIPTIKHYLKIVKSEWQDQTYITQCLNL